MGFTATPLDGSTPPLPMPTAVPDGTNTPLAVEAGPSISTGGNLLAPVSMYVKDGNNLVEGATTDAAVVGDNSGSLSAKLRGLTKILNDVWNSTSHWLNVALQASTTGGSTPSHTMSAASTNATSLKASAGQVYGLSISNANAAARYFKLYNKASAPTVGTDTPVLTLQVPANGTVIRAYPVGLALGTGIAWAATAVITDADTTAIGANDLSVDIDYK